MLTRVESCLHDAQPSALLTKMLKFKILEQFVWLNFFRREGNAAVYLYFQLELFVVFKKSDSAIIDVWVTIQLSDVHKFLAKSPYYCWELCKQPLHQIVKHPTHERQKLVWAENVPSTASAWKTAVFALAQTANISHSAAAPFQKEQHIRPADFRRKNLGGWIHVFKVHSSTMRGGALCGAIGLASGAAKSWKGAVRSAQDVSHAAADFSALVNGQAKSVQSLNCALLLCWPRACDSPSRNTHQHAYTHTHWWQLECCTQHTLGPTYSHHTIAPRLALSIKSSHTMTKF